MKLSKFIERLQVLLNENPDDPKVEIYDLSDGEWEDCYPVIRQHRGVKKVCIAPDYSL